MVRKPHNNRKHIAAMLLAGAAMAGLATGAAAESKLGVKAMTEIHQDRTTVSAMERGTIRQNTQPVFVRSEQHAEMRTTMDRGRDGKSIAWSDPNPHNAMPSFSQTQKYVK